MGTSASTASASVSAQIAAANAHLQPLIEPATRFAGEDGGHSLAEIASTDLDAALQLLAERALYITGATGAAIALRRGEYNDMLCRASAGSNAPELGALLSMEYGLSGESVRTGRILLCDDAERDSRVNHEACRRLAIASVVVMPIASEDQVFGVFELLSGKPYAFGERDLSALRRLSDMVEIATAHAMAAHIVPVRQGDLASGLAHEPVSSAATDVDSADSETNQRFTIAAPPEATRTSELKPQQAPVESKPTDLNPQATKSQEGPKTQSQNSPPEAPAKKPLFWSAAVQAQNSAVRPSSASDLIAVPPILRNLQKCQACGFPVSQGRTLCVECEEKQWRGQSPRPQPATHPGSDTTPLTNPINSVANEASARASVSLSTASYLPPGSADINEPENPIVEPVLSNAAGATLPAGASSGIQPSQPENVLAEVSVSDRPTSFLSSTIEPESWLAANKYILGSLLLVAIVIAAMALLH